MKFQGDILNFYDFIQVYVFSTNHHLKPRAKFENVTDRLVAFTKGDGIFLHIYEYVEEKKIVKDYLSHLLHGFRNKYFNTISIKTIWLVCWLVGCLGFNGPLRQYFSLCRSVSQR